MKLAIDVYYYETKAKSVGLLFNDWTDEQPVEVISVWSNNINEYVPGSFYKRELPCITALLDKIDMLPVDLIIVDGYVFLDDAGKPGLGYYLYEYLNEKIPVIGVAKKSFHDNTQNVVEVLRGNSNNALYISAIGYDKDKAAGQVRSMHGDFRFPTLLKLLDQHTKAEK